MKKKLFAVLALTFILAFLSGCSDIKKKEVKTPVKQQFVSIATGNVGGAYYSMGSALAEILNKEVPGINASAQTTSASGLNANLLAKGEVELAFMQNDMAYYAVNGMAMFGGKQINNIQGIFPLYAEAVQIVALERSGIKSIEQLKGRRVAVGSPGSGTEFNAKKMLEAYGLSFDDIVAQHIPFNEAMGNLLDGRTDVIFTTAGHPVSFIKTLADKEQINILSLDYLQLEKFLKEYPFFVKIKIPKDTYKGQQEDVNTIAVMAVLVANDKIDDEMGYKIAKSVYNNLDKLIDGHQMSKFAGNEKVAQVMSIPLNAGAAKFFSEINK